jgi:gliding motility-associated-like protein
LGANIGSLYRYRIVAHAEGTDWSQSSNTAENLFTYPGGPEWMRWLEASIVTDSVAVVRAEVDASSPEPHAYELWRNEPFDDDFEFVSSVFSTGGVVQMLDSTIEGQVGQYKYYLKVVNACGDSVLGTPVAETIFLNGTVLEDRLSNALSWTAFEGWDAPRTRQVLLRGIQFGGALGEVEDFGPNDFSYDDELEDLTGTPGEFCYRVRAEQGDSGWASVSNQVCLTLPPVVWIPNALVYNGFNNSWRPSIAFADVTDYRLDVFSRWGDLIWTTENPGDAWDGTVDGAMLPEAFYPYTLRIQDGAGRVVTRMGHVMLVLRP